MSMTCAQEYAAKYEDDAYNVRKEELIRSVDDKYCSIVEWIEQALPRSDNWIREVVKAGEPYLPEHILESIPSKKIEETGKMNVLAFVDESGLCDEILDELKRRKQLGTVKKVPLVWDNLDTYEKMEEVLKPKKQAWDVILYAPGVDCADSDDPDDVIKFSDQLVKAYMLIFQVLQRNPDFCEKVMTLTSDTLCDDEEVHREAGVKIAAAGPLFGMSNTLRMEVPTVALHYVDVEYTVTDTIIEDVASEITRKTGFGAASVRINSKGRFVARMTPAEPRYTSSAKFVTPNSGVIGIGGGNGALGLVMGKYLLEHLADPETATVRIKFLSRSCKISGQGNENLWNDIQAIVADKCKGVTVEQAKCDVSSRQAIELFVSENAEDLVGFVHSAGILRDGLLPNQTFEKYDDVYKPKAWAALYLHHALEQNHCDKLQFCWMFSSVAVYGNMGQTNYSGANSLLDVLCRHRKCQGKPAQAMQWAGWGEVGMAASMDPMAKKRMAESPIPFFTNAQGLQGMDVGLSTGIPVFCVMRYNGQSFFNKLEKTFKKDKLNASDRYDSKFWSVSIPPKQVTELELYEYVAAAYSLDSPRELIYDHFINGIANLPGKTPLVPIHSGVYFEDE